MEKVTIYKVYTPNMQCSGSYCKTWDEVVYMCANAPHSVVWKITEERIETPVRNVKTTDYGDR